MNEFERKFLFRNLQWRRKTHACTCTHARTYTPTHIWMSQPNQNYLATFDQISSISIHRDDWNARAEKRNQPNHRLSQSIYLNLIVIHSLDRIFLSLRLSILLRLPVFVFCLLCDFLHQCDFHISFKYSTSKCTHTYTQRKNKVYTKQYYNYLEKNWKTMIKQLQKHTHDYNNNTNNNNKKQKKSKQRNTRTLSNVFHGRARN